MSETPHLLSLCELYELDHMLKYFDISFVKTLMMHWYLIPLLIPSLIYRYLIVNYECDADIYHALTLPKKTSFQKKKKKGTHAFWGLACVDGYIEIWVVVTKENSKKSIEFSLVTITQISRKLWNLSMVTKENSAPEVA